MAAGSDAPFSQIWRLMLLLAFLLAVAWACSSCTVVTGNRTAGTFTYASVAGNAKFGRLGPDGMENGEIDNATGAGVIERTGEKLGRAYAWGKFWDFASEGWSTAEDIVSDNNETDVKINANNNATKESIKTFVPPEPVSEP